MEGIKNTESYKYLVNQLCRPLESDPVRVFQQVDVNGVEQEETHGMVRNGVRLNP